jgi:hypothetical protein
MRRLSAATDGRPTSWTPSAGTSCLLSDRRQYKPACSRLLRRGSGTCGFMW